MKEPACLDLSCAIFLDIKREKKSLVWLRKRNDKENKKE